MPQLEVDQEVYAFIRGMAYAKSLSVNDVLRLILEMDVAPDPKKVSPSRTAPSSETRAPNANLLDLVEAGYLAPDEELVLLDYSGNRHPEFRARVDGKGVVYQGRPYSMSDLASQLLAELGHKRTAVRGPRFWATKDGYRIHDLWEALREGNKPRRSQ